MVRARKACIRAQTIRTTTSPMPITATTRTRESCPFHGSCKASAAAPVANTVVEAPGWRRFTVVTAFSGSQGQPLADLVGQLGWGRSDDHPDCPFVGRRLLEIGELAVE